jgi:hypothetical protein
MPHDKDAAKRKAVIVSFLATVFICIVMTVKEWLTK